MQPQPYVKRPKVSRAKISSPIHASSTSRPPSETTPAPTDLVTISTAAKTLPEDCSEASVRQWVDRRLLPSYANPLAGRRPGPGRPVTRWVSVAELKAFVSKRAAASKERGAPGDPTTDAQ
jgi:hypothetical protein